MCTKQEQPDEKTQPERFFFHSPADELSEPHSDKRCGKRDQ
jgi:hypothetical protein